MCSVDWMSLRGMVGALVKERSLVDVCVGPLRVEFASGDFPLERCGFDMC